MAGPMPPYALFVIVDGIDSAYLSGALTRAYQGNEEAAWMFYLATDNDADAPKKSGDQDLFPDGTEAPVPTDFKSLFIGKTLEDCAKWLQDAPEDVALNRFHFAVIDQFSKQDDTVQMCRLCIEDENEEELVIEGGTLEVKCFPGLTRDSAIEMFKRGFSIDFEVSLDMY